jgi:hypothetical protein
MSLAPGVQGSELQLRHSCWQSIRLPPLRNCLTPFLQLLETLGYSLLTSALQPFLRYNPEVMATPEQQPIIDVARRTLASRRYSELMCRVIVSQSMITSVLELPKASKTFNEQILAESSTGRAGLRTLLEQTTSPEAAEAAIDFDGIADTVARQTSLTGAELITAAAIVLSHSMADDIFTAACESAVELDPASWIPELSMERKVPLSLLRDKGPAGVFAHELDKYRQLLPGRSLPSRAELFFRHVKIRHHSKIGPADVRYFRQSRLVEADNLQNNILHSGAMPQIDLELGQQIVLFLHEAAITALRSLAAAYRLPVQWNILSTGPNETVD